ncbi:MAG: hypothetical protein BWK80_15810 [Desulfobacteraceae bacterium IS3]|nr:MAG: hypothetical protein BWK80_15810 [Desulfobacteraceae bacterium IS3]
MLMLGMLIAGIFVFPLHGASAQNLKPVLILADVSGSMQDDTEGYYQNEQNREDIAKVHVLKELILRMSPELSCDSGIYRFRYLSGDSRMYEIFMPAAAYKHKDRAEKVQKEFASDYSMFNRRTPIADMLRQLDEQELEKMKGRITLLLISDGRESFYDPEDKKGPLTTIRSLKEKYGAELTVHTVFVPQKSESNKSNKSNKSNNDDTKGKELLENMAKDGEGRCFYAPELLKNPEDMTALCGLLCQKKIEEVRAAPPEPLPEPEKPAVAAVVKPPSPSDADGDGVYDEQDECPDTPRGARVNIKGCWVLEGLLFAFDKWDIRSQYYPILDEAAVILKKNPGLKAEIQGHTDNKGTAAYNEKLSRKRAESVKAYLVKKGIESERLTTSGYGFTKPVAPNKTKEGRALNRRVELKPIW